MRSIAILLLLLVAGACAAPKAGLNEMKPDTADRPAAAGDAADAGAGVLLLHQNRERAGLVVRRVDPATGGDLPGYTPLAIDTRPLLWASYALSSSGERLAVVESRGRSCDRYAGGSRCRPGADVVHVVNLESRQEVTATLSGSAYADPVSFSPDESTLAIGLHEQGSYTLTVLDTAEGRLIAQRRLPFEPTLLAYTGRGTEIAAFGSPPGSPPGMGRPGAPRLLLVDAATLETRWEQELPDVVSGAWCLEACQAEHGRQLFGYWSPAVALDRNTGRLYVVHADAELLTTLDLEAHTVHTAPIQAAGSWLHDLLALGPAVVQAKGGTEGAVKAAVLSPDGQRLYVVGQAMHSKRDAEQGWQSSEEGLGLEVIDVATGRHLAQRDGAATDLQLSPDGAYVLLGSWREGEPYTEVVDAGSLETVAHLAGWEAAVSRRPGGSAVILLSRRGEAATEIAMLAVPAMAATQPWSVPGSTVWVGVP